MALNPALKLIFAGGLEMYLNRRSLYPAKILHGLSARVEVFVASSAGKEAKGIVRAFIEIHHVKAELAAGSIRRSRLEGASCRVAPSTATAACSWARYTHRLKLEDPWNR